MKSNLKSAYDLLCLLCLSILLLSAIPASQMTALRVVLGVLFVIFFPGYAIVAALFPRRGALTAVERLGLSFSSSIPASFCVGFILNYTPWGITVNTTAISLVLLTVSACAVAYYRRIALPQDKHPATNRRSSLADPHNQVRSNRFLSGMLTLSIVAVIGTLLYFLAQPKTDGKFTEFYILGASRKAEGYPREVLSGEPIALVIGIVNHEHADVPYTVKVIENTSADQIVSVQLSHQDRWEQPYTLTLDEPGEDNKITFLLYKGDDGAPYRSLHLWVTVREERSTS